jgi:hypothetical protein
MMAGMNLKAFERYLYMMKARKVMLDSLRAQKGRRHSDSQAITLQKRSSPRKSK